VLCACLVGLAVVLMLVCASGSGKSYVARTIRDVEKEEGGSCRILCLDDYFLTEVTKVRSTAFLYYKYTETEQAGQSPGRQILVVLAFRVMSGDV
jgi:ABC-type glutathione transport system ATPase component